MKPDKAFRRTKQCAACPWKKGTSCEVQIPGYKREKHLRLTSCQSNGFTPGSIMACHESKEGRDFACVGWLVHQLGDGNNIPLRLAAVTGRLPADQLEVYGEQYESLEKMIAREP